MPKSFNNPVLAKSRDLYFLYILKDNSFNQMIWLFLYFFQCKSLVFKNYIFVYNLFVTFINYSNQGLPNTQGTQGNKEYSKSLENLLEVLRNSG